MPTVGIAELTLQERGILASSAFAAYLDHFSSADRVLVSAFQQPVKVIRNRTYYSHGEAYTIQWQDFGQPLPLWFDPTMQGFVDLLTLASNWDSYHAAPIDQRLVNDAMTFVNTLLTATSPAPRVVPLSSGGLQIEWHRNGVDVEVVFDPGEQPFFYFQNRVSGEESEHSLPENTLLLGSIIASLE